MSPAGRRSPGAHRPARDPWAIGQGAVCGYAWSRECETPAVEVIRDGAPVPGRLRGGAVAVGVFDAVHRGHRALLAALREAAGDRSAVVVTFDRPAPRPAVEARPPEALLVGVDHRLELLAAEGVDCRVLGSGDETAPLPVATFLERVLVTELAATAVVVGDELRYGLGRRADVDTLRGCARRVGLDVVAVPALTVGDPPETVSASLIRRRLAAGDVGSAEALLGRAVEVRGVVEHGDGRGRALGYPTANVAVGGDIALPGDGVYAGRYVLPDGTDRPAAVSIGRRPTFYREHGLRLVEAFLIDYAGDLYGQEARIRVTRRLRGQEAFDTAAALVAQMDRDVEAIRAVEGAAP